MSKKYTLEEIIEKSNSAHNHRYDYTQVVYKNMHQKVNIICKEHGIFPQTMADHINKKRGCKKCALADRKDTHITFEKKANIVHNNEYTYYQDYIDSKTKIKINCIKHTDFFQRPTDHINNKQGCPLCNESKGEKKIRLMLEEKNIEYTQEKRFDDCKDKQTLPFDFYLPKYNICIEFDGEQHFKIVEGWGGEDKYNNILKHDKIKNVYCKENNIKLIRFRYDEEIDFNKIIR